MTSAISEVAGRVPLIPQGDHLYASNAPRWGSGSQSSAVCCFYFFVGGKFLNSLSMALLNVLTFLSELSASVSFATPRQTISLSGQEERLAMIS